jgi:hypothetical protein
MATEKLNINGWDAGWPTGLLSNVDEAIADADAQTVGTNITGDVVIFDLDPTALIDGDEVTDVGITVRATCSGLGFDLGYLDVELLIGGAAQGAAQRTSSMVGTQNHVLSSASWDSDWTQAQLEGMQVRVTTVLTGGNGDTPTWTIDCIDVDVTYTPSVVPTAAATLAIASEVPVATVSADSPVFSPAAAAVSIAGQSPPLGLALPVAEVDIRVRPTPSYVNPLQLRLNPTGWDNGWPTGFLSNIDEPVASADGQTISSTTQNEAVTLDFAGAASTITATDTVIDVQFLVRARQPSIPAAYGLNSVVYIGGAPLISGAQKIYPTFSDEPFEWDIISQNGFDDGQPVPWTAAELEQLQIKFLYGNNTVGTETFIDAVDAIITYSPQSPLIITPPTAELTVAGYAPVSKYDVTTEPLLGTLTLAGQAVDYRRTDSAITEEDALTLTGLTPVYRVDFLPLPLLGTLALTGEANVKVVNHLALPAATSLVLAGEIPVSEATADWVTLPARVALTLAPEAPLRQDGINDLVGPLVGSAVVAGYVPTLDVTFDRIAYPAQAAVVLAGVAPTAVKSQVTELPGSVALSLAANVPVSSIKTIIPVSEVDLSFASVRPQLGGLNAELTLATQLPLRVVGKLAAPAATSLTLAGQTPIRIYNDPTPLSAYIQLAGYAPTLTFSTILAPGGQGLISVTVDYSIEIIATPTNILLE